MYNLEFRSLLSNGQKRNVPIFFTGEVSSNFCAGCLDPDGAWGALVGSIYQMAVRACGPRRVSTLHVRW